MNRPKIFVTQRLALEPVEVLGAEFDVEVFPHDRPITREELLTHAAMAQAIVPRPADLFDRALLEALPRLEIVANHAVGFDNVDLAAARALGLWVTNTPGVLTAATAELTWALLLALARRVREGEDLVRSGRFGAWTPTLLLGAGLAGHTLGIFGYGRIGQAVARVGQAFGMRVIATSRSPIASDAGVEQVDKAALLARSEVLSIHCPLTPETRHAFSDAEFAAMRSDALLINTARGPVIDEAALVRALEAGRIGGAGLDVYEHEPAVHPRLLARQDVVLLPHLGSATRETRRKMAELALTDAARVLRGERPLHVVVEGRPRPVAT